jgi:glycosyltransferase involved in cell wall biosynthesis
VPLDVLVSIITPAYNVERWIGESIDSALRQTESRFELIVVDDGSTDGTPDIVRRKAATDPRIRLVSTPNGGSAAARNAGLKVATAPLVSFLDGDDRWHPQLLHHLLATLRDAPPHTGAVFAHSRVMLASGRTVSLRWQPSGLCDLDRILVENCPPHGGSSLLLRRSCFDEVGDFDTALPSATDFEMWLRIATHASTPAFVGIRRWLVDYRVTRPGAISGNRTARYRALDTILDRYTPQLTRLPAGLAYVRPAVFAYRDGADEFGERWARQALEAGRATVTHDHWGVALLAWHQAGPHGRERMRQTRDTLRAAFYRGADLAARLVPTGSRSGRSAATPSRRGAG